MRENHLLYNNIPDSELYKCNKCLMNLKVWPKEKLESAQCTYCEKKVTNDGTNVHVCFSCGGDHLLLDKYYCHLCSDHGQVGNMVEVTWEPDEFFLATADSTSASAPPNPEVPPPEFDPTDIAPPTYEEAITLPNVTYSKWKDNFVRKPQQFIRQYSSRTTDEESMVPLGHQQSTNPDFP